MSAHERQGKIQAALAALQVAEVALDEAQEFSDSVGARPDVDGCMELAILLTQQASSLTQWARSLLEDGAAAQRLP